MNDRILKQLKELTEPENEVTNLFRELANQVKFVEKNEAVVI